jgi:uncharacterized membrane protein
MEIVFGVLLLAAIPIAGIAAFFMVLGARHRLDALERRMALFEQRLTGAAAASVVVEPAPARESPAPQQPAPQPAPVPAAKRAESIPTSVPPMTPASAAAAAATPDRPSVGFEEKFGTRWVVYIGGLALALGGIFLVKYSIEQGLLGPGMRIFMGGVLAAALVIAGEWMRRQENRSGLAGISPAHIPSILTAAGTTVAYATVYAGYALYGFFGPALAFILLGAVALATLGAALLHGPALAGLGLVGAYVTPLLVSSDKPSYWALYLYLAVVTAAAFGLARMRLWRWLAVTAMVMNALWILPGIDSTQSDILVPHALHAAVGFALVAALIVSGFLYGPSAERGRIETVSSAALALYLFAAALLVLATRHDPVSFIAFSLLVFAAIAIAWRSDAALAAVPAAAVLVAVVMWHWAVAFDFNTLVAPNVVTAGLTADPNPALLSYHLILGAAFALLFGAAGFLAQARTASPIIAMLWALSAVAAPIVILMAVYYRVAGVERSIPFAALALLLAVLYGYALEFLNKLPAKPGQAAAGAIFAVGGIASLALALTLAMEKGWLTVALALMVPGIAWVERQRPLPALRWTAAVIIALVVVRIGWEPRIVGSDVGTTPIFNWLLWGYGVPAVSFWVAGYLLRKRADDVPARMADSAAILFTVLTAFLQVRHYINGGDIYRVSSGLTEIALQICVGLALVIGLERVRERSHSIVHNIGALIIGALTLAAIFFGLVIAKNPMLPIPFRPGLEVGGLIFNVLLLAYGIPAMLAAALALMTRATRPQSYRAVAAVTAVTLALLYLTLEVARFYQGPIIRLSAVSDAEQYTYSAVWLVFGVALLVIGFLLRSQPLRYCSAAVVVITIGKVFLLDMAGLTGVFRALSFICLGLVLVGIGLLYQRLLYRPAAPLAAAPS